MLITRMEAPKLKFWHQNGAVTAMFLCACTAVAHAGQHAALASPADEWLRNRLMNPTPSQRAAEARGQVFIYDSLNADEIDAAMNVNFDRIENMMFTRIHHLPETGSGPAEVEDDGCE